MKLAVIIPMYNEENGVQACLEKTLSIVEQNPHIHLFAVNDGSRDRTLVILESLQKEKSHWPLTIVNADKNWGYGGACLLGAKTALSKGFEFGLFMDSDLTNDPALISAFFEKLLSGHFDFIKASRYIPGGGMRNVPWNRQLITIFGNQLASRLFKMGIHDCTNGFRAVRLSLLSDLVLNERGFPAIMEELYHLKKKKAVGTEIPYVLTNRTSGKSSFTYSKELIWAYLKYALKARRLSS